MARKKPAVVDSEKPVIRDPFAVIPLKPDNVDLKRDSAGMIHLRLNVPPKGLKKRVADWLGYDYTKKVELDEFGTFYYGMVDGATTLNTITEKMMRQFGKSRKETEGPVILFTKKLMVMNMIMLQAPLAAPARSSHEQS